MPINSIPRTVIYSDGSKREYTEQKYIRKHSDTYYNYVKNTGYMKAFLAIAIKESKHVKGFLKKDDLKGLNKYLNNTQIFKKDDFANYKLTKNDLTHPTTSKKLKLYNPLKKRVVQNQKSNPRHDGVLRVSRLSTLGIYSLNDTKRDIKNKVDFWLMILKAGQPKLAKRIGDDPNVINTLNVVVSLDTEWKHHSIMNNGDFNKGEVTVRRLEDVLNVSYCIWFPDFPDEYLGGVVFNKTNQAFNLRQFFAFLIDEIQSKFNSPDNKVLMLKRLNMLLTGYFLGVDLSAFGGWNRLKANLIVKKQYVFTSQPFVFNVKSQGVMRRLSELHKTGEQPKENEDLNGVDCFITIRDSGLLGPIGGLGELGSIVGISKLDTTKDDTADNKPYNYYKTHMTEYYKAHPKRYIKYVLTDAVIPIKYLQKVMTTYNLSWLPFSCIPVTTSNYAMQGVQSALLGEESSQRIFSPKISKWKVKDDPVNAVRSGYKEGYILACDAFYGGFNPALFSGLVYGNPVDTDLSQAYNTAGHLMGVPNYTASVTDDLDEIGNKTVAFYGQKVNFKRIYSYLKRLKGFPFILGVGKASFEYGKDYSGITLTPIRSEKTDSPIYVKSGIDKELTIIDMIDAYEHGASVIVSDLVILAQSFDRYNAWGDAQDKFSSLRKRAKRLRDNAENSRIYGKYEGEQKLFKLAGNTIYGKSAQSIRPKRTHNYNTNAMENIPISGITDPFIGGAYTAITRYLVHLLYDSVVSFYGSDCLPLNITTDGFSFMLKPDLKFDFGGVNKIFESKLPVYYMNRLHAMGSKYGFERKGETKDFDKNSWTFNLKTRFNGTVDINCLDAMVGVQSNTYSVKDIVRYIARGTVAVPVKHTVISNLTEMKFGSTNHQQGWLYDEVKSTEIGLQYDCFYKPYKWVCDSYSWIRGFGFIVKPFNDEEAHDTWKKHSKLLTDRYNITISKERFETYLDTMNNYSFLHTSELDKPDYQSKIVYVDKKLNDEDVPTIREYKDVLSRVRVNLRKGKKISVCMLAKYKNQLPNRRHLDVA